jgi:1A family penicillin-binding protein
VLLLAVASGTAWLWKLYRDVESFVAARALGPLRIFSSPLVLRPGLSTAGARLIPRLRRLGYRELTGGPVSTGTFRATPGRIEIGLRGFVDAAEEEPERHVMIDLGGDTIVRVRQIDGPLTADGVSLEPELLGSYAGGVLGERKPVRLAGLPAHVVAAVLAAEDERFATHPGIDPVGVLRAAMVNVKGGGVLQGGSTITQQLAKNALLTPERRWSRKVTEAVLSVLLELRLTKQEILEAYLDTVYMGRVGSIGLYGIAPGARAFFGKEPTGLTAAEAATIAGIIHAPNADSPIRHPERALARRNLVLRNMASNGWLGEAELARALAEPLRPSRQGLQPLEAPFFVDEVLRRLTQLGISPEHVRGMAVYTTVDLELQRAVDHDVAEGLAGLEKRFRRLRSADHPLQAAVVVLEAQSGLVRAIVGGRDFTQSQFNRATRSRRQPGSAFKPFVYLAALDDAERPMTAASHVRDEPLRWRVGRDVWSPTNYDRRFLGEVSVRRALEDSRNVPTVVVAEHVGFPRVAELARLVGLGTIRPVPAIALGTAEVTPLDLVGAYTVFPNLGEVTRPALIRGVLTSDGTVFYQDRLVRRRVATGAATYVTSNLLAGVVNSGTGAGVRRLGLRQPVAGKTGTTNDSKDAWFIGYSPDVVAGTWVGFDDGTPLGLSGATAALPIWVRVMKDSLALSGARSFPVPAGVVFRDIDPVTGFLAGWSCPGSIREAFVMGTEPRSTCDGQSLPAAELPIHEDVLEPDAAHRPVETSPSNPWKATERWLEGWFGGR